MSRPWMTVHWTDVQSIVPMLALIAMSQGTTFHPPLVIIRILFEIRILYLSSS